MKIAVFGATGSVGRHVVRQAEGLGHEVTALVRDPVKLNDESVAVVQGDVLDPVAVRDAVDGQEAVIVVLGAGRRGGVRGPGTRVIIDAMRDAGVQRLIVQSTLGVGDSRPNLPPVWRYLMFGLLLRPAYADHVEQEQHVRDSGLRWTIVRPAAFTDGPRTGVYRHGFGPDAEDLSSKISRADVADFLLGQLTSPSYVHRTPGLSYARP
ncbi:MAG: SDR family oxidoreductase [Microbacterium sp.]|nr:SDR family oxidoreductase [Microbacterium sp.]